MSILNTIVAHKKKEVASTKELIPIPELEKFEYFNRKTISFKDHIIAEDKTGIIGEFKRKSPSKGIINNTARVEEVTKGYALAGASALSVLTDFIFFGGVVDDLRIARAANKIPILRKEFIIDEYQILEAKAIGADAVLLIASILEIKKAKDLARKAHDIGLQVLMEIHDENELSRINEHVDVVGVNNRNLDTFVVDLQHSVSLSEMIPDGFVKISESGISKPEDILFLRQHGFDGFLIGENFMKNDDPVFAFSEFVKKNM
ncbi:MAG: indole-3-glycerol phosphate synthase TrpC [Bacteroidales bacterium]|nr:indole-3-glycerol phosphate synthase TrpC [Bacteroidales bacterium]